MRLQCCSLVCGAVFESVEVGLLLSICLEESVREFCLRRAQLAVLRQTRFIARGDVLTQSGRFLGRSQHSGGSFLVQICAPASSGSTAHFENIRCNVPGKFSAPSRAPVLDQGLEADSSVSESSFPSSEKSPDGHLNARTSGADAQ